LLLLFLLLLLLLLLLFPLKEQGERKAFSVWSV
jgi:hypothetical protein